MKLVCEEGAKWTTCWWRRNKKMLASISWSMGFVLPYIRHRRRSWGSYTSGSTHFCLFVLSLKHESRFVKCCMCLQNSWRLCGSPCDPTVTRQCRLWWRLQCVNAAGRTGWTFSSRSGDFLHFEQIKLSRLWKRCFWSPFTVGSNCSNPFSI